MSWFIKITSGRSSSHQKFPKRKVHSDNLNKEATSLNQEPLNHEPQQN